MYVIFGIFVPFFVLYNHPNEYPTCILVLLDGKDAVY